MGTGSVYYREDPEAYGKDIFIIGKDGTCTMQLVVNYWTLFLKDDSSHNSPIFAAYSLINQIESLKC